MYNDYKPIPPFNRFVLQNFPFIEDDFDALNTYQLLCKIVDYLNKVINAQNELGESQEVVIAAFNQLKDYVDHYFDNLDVQEEINNKLDEMTEDGTLQEIVSSYLQANVCWTFDTVADMKNATNLIAGSYAKTLGYHAIDDGGAATYYITDTGTANEEDVIAVGLLYANLVIGDAITPEMFGAYGDGTHDDTEIMQDCIDYVSEKPVKLKLIHKYLLRPNTTVSERKVCLLLRTKITIEGNGSNSGLIIDDTNNNIYWAAFYADSGSAAMENIVIDNFEIYQNSANLSDIEVTNSNPRYIFYTSNAITNYSITRVIFNHVYSRDVIMIPTGDATTNVNISRCTVNYYSVLDRVLCSDCTVFYLNCKNYLCNDNIIYGADFTCKGGIELHGCNGTAKNNKIIGFVDCMHLQPSGNTASNFEVENNYMYGYDGVNLWDSVASSSVGLSDVRIINNYIEIEAGESADERSAGIRLSDSSFTHPVSNVIIKNNTINFVNIDTTRTIANAYCGGIVMNNSTANITDIYIINNTITNSISAGIKIGSTSGLATTTNSNIIIKENIIKDCSQIPSTQQAAYDSAIVLYSKYLKNIVVEDNMLLNNIVGGGATYSFYGIGTVDATDRCYVKNNIIRSVNQGDMTVAGVSTWVYQYDRQVPIFSPNGTKYYIKVANDGTLSTATS